MNATAHQALPADLSRFAKKQFLKRVIPCAFLFIAILLALIFWGDAIVPTDNPIVRVIVSTLLSLIPFLIFGIPWKLIDRTYRGEILRVDIKTTVDNASSIHPTRELLYRKNTIYLHVLLEGGQTVRRKVYEGDARLAQHLDTYHAGDRVFHLYGSQVTVKLLESADTAVQCAACGNISHTESVVCEVCGRTLIKN